MRLLSLVLRTIMPSIKHTTAIGTVFAPVSNREIDPDCALGPGRPRESETDEIDNISFTVHFRLLNEFY